MIEKITKYENKLKVEYRNEKGEVHNINDEPAFICYRTKEWFKNGKIHRTKGPALIHSNEDEYWFYEDINITNKVNQLMDDGKINSDWCNWSEEDEFLFVLLVS